MAFKLIVRDIVPIQVRGSLKDDKGHPERFDFTLQCRRTGQRDLAEAMTDNQRKCADFMAGVVLGWTGVCDTEGQAVPFSPGALDQLLDTPGLAVMAFNAYVKDQAATEKN